MSSISALVALQASLIVSDVRTGIVEAPQVLQLDKTERLTRGLESGRRESQAIDGSSSTIRLLRWYTGIEHAGQKSSDERRAIEEFPAVSRQNQDCVFLVACS